MVRWGLQVLPDVLVLRMFGQMDEGCEGLFEKVAVRALSLGNRRVVIDFSEAGTLDPLSLVYCGYGLYHFHQIGIPFSLIKPPANLLPILQQHGLPDLTPVFLQEPDSRWVN